MRMRKEFKNFVLKGNILDLAVAVIMGAAFNKIVSSFVNDVIMPPIGVLLGGVDFKDLKFAIQDESGDVAAVTINYGSFIQTIIDFIIIGFVVFMVIRTYNRMQKKKEEAPAAPAAPPKQEVLLEEIRDLLKK
jgi:large conductance mechanosensitive channel